MRLQMTYLLPILVFSILFPTFSTAESLDNWLWRNPMPTGNSLNNIAYGNGVYVVVGDAGTILNSLDGENWRFQRTDTAAKLIGVTFGNNVFVAVGEGGTVLTSLDGISWNKGISGITLNINGIVYGNKTFVAYSSASEDAWGGKFLTSSDGIIWTLFDVPGNGFTPENNPGTLRGVAYGNDTFVAIFASGSAMTSLDGYSWQWSFYRQGSDQYFTVTYGNNMFVATSGSWGMHATYTGHITTSPDGRIWTKAPFETNAILGMAYGNNVFIAVGFTSWLSSLAFSEILFSPDGERWNLVTGLPFYFSSELEFLGVAFINDTFFVVGNRGNIYSSPNGTTWSAWTKRSSTATEKDLSGVAYGNNLFVAVGGGSNILESRKGGRWESRNLEISGCLNAITYGHDTFVAVGDPGIILTSPDGDIWTSRDSGTSESLNAITYGNNTFVVVGSSGTILTSPDGLVWEKTASGASAYLTGIAYGNRPPFSWMGIPSSDSTFVAVGHESTLLFSSDAVTWMPHIDSDYPHSYFLGIAFGKNTFVVIKDSGTPDQLNMLILSDAGKSYRVGPPNLKGITFGNGSFAAVGDGYVFPYEEGVSENRIFLGTNARLRAISYGSDSFIAVGSRGVILQSYPHLIFSDFPPDHWAYEYIMAIYDEGITIGCSQDNLETPENEAEYCPENYVTREQMAKFILSALNQVPSDGYCGKEKPFTDVPVDRWSCKYIKRLAELRITTGYEDGSFHPEEPISREGMATFLIRAVNEVPADGYCGVTNPFTDVPFDRWSCKYVKRFQELGINTGYGDDRYGTLDPVTRAQMAVFLSRAFLGME